MAWVVMQPHRGWRHDKAFGTRYPAALLDSLIHRREWGVAGEFGRGKTKNTIDTSRTSDLNGRTIFLDDRSR